MSYHSPNPTADINAEDTPIQQRVLELRTMHECVSTIAPEHRHNYFTALDRILELEARSAYRVIREWPMFVDKWLTLPETSKLSARMYRMLRPQAAPPLRYHTFNDHDVRGFDNDGLKFRQGTHDQRKRLPKDEQDLQAVCALVFLGREKLYDDYEDLRPHLFGSKAMQPEEWYGAALRIPGLRKYKEDFMKIIDSLPPLTPEEEIITDPELIRQAILSDPEGIDPAKVRPDLFGPGAPYCLEPDGKEGNESSASAALSTNGD